MMGKVFGLLLIVLGIAMLANVYMSRNDLAELKAEMAAEREQVIEGLDKSLDELGEALDGAASK